MEALHPGAVELELVRRQRDPEINAPGGELYDEIGKALVVRVSSGVGAQIADTVVGDGVPGEEELLGARVQKTNRAELTGRTGSSNCGP
jgi:hypothetical protein